MQPDRIPALGTLSRLATGGDGEGCEGEKTMAEAAAERPDGLVPGGGGGGLEEQLEGLTHEELCEVTESALRRLLAADRLLADLPGDVTADEALAQVAVAHGRSVTVTVLRHDEKPLRVVIGQQGTTVRELKRAVQRAFSLVQRRSRSRARVSWRHVWRANHLQVAGDGGGGGALLEDDRRPVERYGVRNHTQLRFVRRLQARRRDRRPRSPPPPPPPPHSPPPPPPRQRPPQLADRRC